MPPVGAVPSERRNTPRTLVGNSSDPFLQISRANETPNDFTLVHRTEHINNNVNPTWKKFIIPLRTLCNGDIDRNLRVECFDYNNNGKHSLIGEFNVTARQLMEGPGPTNIHPCINKKKKVNVVCCLF